jgi:RNA polymerase sigma factor (sigma-70 family)
MSRDDPRITRVLPDYRRWLYREAYAMIPATSADLEDLVQEGAIALWRALGTYDPDKGSLPAWLTRTARRRMLDVRSGRARATGAERDHRAEHGTSSGAESRRRIREHLAEHPDATGAQIATATGLSQATVSFHRRRLDMDTAPPLAVTSLDEFRDAGGDVDGGLDTLDAVIAAYHDGRVAQALDALTDTQRRYVRLRFWHGLGTTDLTRAFGYDPRGVWKGARDRLRQALADLVAA